MWKTHFASLLLLALCTFCGATIINVDPERGNDNQCLSNASLDVPCQSLGMALNTTQLHNNSEDLIVLLSDGVHLLVEEIKVPGPPDFASVIIQAESTGGSIIRCGADGVGISVEENVNLAMVGVVLENCGPNATGVSLNGSKILTLHQCVFRNNLGVPVFSYNVKHIEITDCQFIDNHNFFPAPPNHVSLAGANLYNGINSGTAGVSLISVSITVNITIRNSHFLNNTASKNDGDNGQLSLRPVGRGGAALIRLVGTSNSLIEISDCTFTNNHAEVEGAGVYLSLSEQASLNQILLTGNEFKSNTVELGAGGALALNSLRLSLENSVLIQDCVFIRNRGDSGGAVSFSLYDNNEESVLRPDTLHFHNCSFQRNSAVNEGTAVGLFSLLHVEDVGFPVHFSDCLFENNTSLDVKMESSALVVFRFQSQFSGHNQFRGNIGGGLQLISAYLRTSGTVVFEGNTAIVGGGITMNDRCLMDLSPGVDITFVGNRAQESGGAIYALFPLIRFSVTILNRLCFIQFNDGSGRDIPPQDWKNHNVSLKFYNNSAGLDGAAVYASTMHQCSWFGENVTLGPSNSIFNFPDEVADESPFIFQGNKLDVAADSVSLLQSPDLSTAPFTMLADTDHKTVQSDEILSITILASDQVNNSREAVWVLESPNGSTILDAVGTSVGTFHYTTPSFQYLSTDNSSAQSTNFSLGVVPLNTLGDKVQLQFETKGCHPGYIYNEDKDTCQCDTGDGNIVRCDDFKRYIYLSEGIWGGIQDRGGKRVLVTARVLPDYLSCRRDGRLPGCLFQFDNIDAQCSNGREGALCGTCKDGYGVTMDLQTCTSTNCAIGLVLLLFCCILVVCFSLLILYFNISLPNELKGFFFYAQVIAVIYRAYTVNKDPSDTEKGLSVTVNLLGYGLPFPLCLSRSLEAHQVAVFTYISPLLVIATVIGYTIAARFVKTLSERSALRGITFLFLIIYKYLADASFIFVSCTYLDPRLVFLYDGSKSCTGWKLGVLGLISVTVIMALFVVPAPFAVGYICVKYPKRFHQWADALTNNLKMEQRWWGGWDIGRRLPFVFLGYLVGVTSPSIVLFLMCATSMGVLLVHVTTLPYKKLYTNIIETVILALLLIINSSLVESSSIAVSEELVSFLVLLPYFYAIGYIAYKTTAPFWVRYAPRFKFAKEENVTSKIEPGVSGASPEEMETEQSQKTDESNQPTVRTSDDSTDGSRREEVRSSGHDQKSNTDEDDLAYREPLLDM